RGAVGPEGDTDGVDRPDRAPLDRLPLGEALDRVQAVAVARRVLEPLVPCRLAHLPLELSPDRAVVAREKLDHPVDDPAVVLLGDVLHAGGEAALDVVVEARDAAVPARLGSLARPVAEDAVEHVERLAHLLRVRVRPEVEDAATVPLTREHHTRVLVLDRDGDVRERLVVAQAHVERGPVALDEVLLEMERLDLAARYDRLDVGDAVDELVDAEPVVAAPGLEVLAHARTQRLGLADVKDVSPSGAEDVDARLRREAFQLVFDMLGPHMTQRIGALARIGAASLVLLFAVGCGGPKPHPIVVGAVEDTAKNGDPVA